MNGPGSFSVSSLASVGVAVLISFLASLGVVGLVYWGLQGLSAWYLRKRKVGEAKCWFLPHWGCFRLVIRNIRGRHTLHFMKWRVWLRKIIPEQPGSSVKTFVDTDFSAGERIFLPTGQDIPMACFRFDDSGGNIKLLVTDKLGYVLESHDLDGYDSIMAEYHVEVRHRVLFKFKHIISRIIFMPVSKDEIKGKPVNFLRDYYLAKQKDSSETGAETQVRVYKLEEEVSVEL